MAESIIIIDSDDDESSNKEAKLKTDSDVTVIQNGKRTIEIINQSESTPAKKRRIQPKKVGEIDITKAETTSNNKHESKSDGKLKDDSIEIISPSNKEINNEEDETSKHAKNEETNDNQKDFINKNEITKELEAFINACRKAENNSDMKKIIKTKLMKYYDLVHPDYAKSRHLCKMLEDRALAILRDPKTVYSKLQDIINELKSRKNCGPIVVAPLEVDSQEKTSEENGEELQKTGDEKKDSRLIKLNRALTKLKKAIEDLEEEEVNFDDDDDSTYLKKSRYEKRAIEIYNKICDITGESSHAHRIVKQPIKFKNTKYKEFNKRLSKKINKNNGFPNFYDVYRLLDYCNKQYKYGLLEDEIYRNAHLAFDEVGKLLKERRFNDIYESAEHYVGKNKDPAKEDPELKAKLEKNKEYYKKKTDEIIQLFVAKQQKCETEQTDTEPGEASTSKSSEDQKSNITSANIKACNNKQTEKVEKDLKNYPTENIVSIIDIKAECDMNGETIESPIDLAISL